MESTVAVTHLESLEHFTDGASEKLDAHDKAQTAVLSADVLDTEETSENDAPTVETAGNSNDSPTLSSPSDDTKQLDTPAPAHADKDSEDNELTGDSDAAAPLDNAASSAVISPADSYSLGDNAEQPEARQNTAVEEASAIEEASTSDSASLSDSLDENTESDDCTSDESSPSLELHPRDVNPDDFSTSTSDAEDDEIVNKPPKNPFITPGNRPASLIFDDISICPFSGMPTPPGFHHPQFMEGKGCAFAPQQPSSATCPVTPKTKPKEAPKPIGLASIASDLIGSIVDPLPAQDDRPFMPFNAGVLLIVNWALYGALTILAVMMVLTHQTPLQIHVAIMFFLCACLLGSMRWFVLKRV